MKKIYLILLVVLTAYSGIAQRIPRPGYKATQGSCNIQQIVAMLQADPRFSDACNRHDRCYQTCNSSKVACDEEFYRGMIAACNNDAACLIAADVFFHAISNSDAGREAYNAAQRRACISCDELLYFKQPNITVPFCEGEQAPVEVMPLLVAGIRNPQFVWSNGTSGSQRTIVRPIDPAAISVSVTFTGDDNKPYTCAADATVAWKQSDCSGNAEKAWYIPILEAIDPNDIIGPEGFGPGKMVSSKKPLPYTIRFENDSTVATAAAQIVRINQKLDAKLDSRTLRLGSFGFAGMTFDVPADRSYYSTRLDVRDSLGVVVDVIAGINVETGEAFWIFESKDPATDLPPADATLGFLPVNTPDHKGEGFVTYTIQSTANVQTGDTVHAKASIVFDINGAIETPPIWNTLDAGDPNSNMKPLPENTRGTELTLEWEGRDDTNGSGVSVYDVFVSKDNAPFTLYKGQVAGNTTTFSGVAGSYRFFSIATDNVEHREIRKTDEEAITNWRPALDCNNDTTVAPDDGVCAAIVNGIDPKRGSLPATTVFSYTLTGATTGSGTGTVSGRSFNQGVTIVTYTANTTPALSCIFTVTVLARQEICDNQIDDDCDGAIDEDCTPMRTWYRDADGDNFGNLAMSTTAPAKPDGYVDNSTDCNDNDNTIYPGAAELCDNKDNDCDGQTDEGCPVSHPTWYRDNDRDNFGDRNSSVNAANKPDGYVADNTDCNDNDNTIYPNAPEVCDNKDNNCNGTTDENCIPQGTTWYRDKDVDGFGNAADTKVAVAKPDGYVDNDKDCNDENANVHPGATEICDGIDNNCDGRGDDCAPGLYVKVAPNPSRSYFKLIIKGDPRELVTVTLRNAVGKTVQVVTVAANTSPEIGHSLLAGVYYAEIIQGGIRTTVKLVKQ